MKISFNFIRKSILAAGLVLALLICAVQVTVAAGEVLLGSPDFRPTPDRPMGWRGDGSGHFPGATPPVRWGQAAKSVKGLRAQAAKPKEGDKGKPIPDGVIREWLVLAPVTTNEQALFKPSADGKIDPQPDENAKQDGATWKKMETDTSVLDFRPVFGEGRPKIDVALAHSYVYSETNALIRIVTKGCQKIYLNGVPAKGDLKLEKGWNRLLFSAVCAEANPEWGKPKRTNWFLESLICGAPGSQYEQENIKWMTRIPGWSIASPVIAGDRIFVLGELRTICCVNKADGKILWVRTATSYDAATDDEKKANPEIFKEIEPLAARLAELDKSFADAAPPTGNPAKEKIELEGKIDKLMAKVNKEKYDGVAFSASEAGYSPRTPVTDGQRVYANFHPCVTVCYDLQGKRLWSHVQGFSDARNFTEHGCQSSPVLAGGKLIVNAYKTIAFDAETGKVAWQTPPAHLQVKKDASADEKAYAGGRGYGYKASLLSLTLGGEALLLTPVDVVRIRDGKQLAYFGPCGCIPTPVVQGGLICRASGGDKCDFMRLPEKPDEPFKMAAPKSVTINAPRFPREFSATAYSSALFHDGLAYTVNADGMLSVIDAEKGEVVYQKLLDIDNGPGGPVRGVQGASPALAGQYIYIFGNMGSCLVLKPGREYQTVAKNRIESIVTGSAVEVPWQTLYGTQIEQTVSCPVFEGKSMFYRGMINLYCIEEK